ncbi:DUF4105 domain-containing protein [Dasania marina]|uniref:Lnb N-terminal periplasmic domain-containing protein n=1 Tax=Dasania marina TaxID=471499 RepID=UPI0030DC8DC7|tara:strand:+ start:17057 stop:18124 length:1068 start_codon:yes stop_codon:yes gene_type:complete
MNKTKHGTWQWLARLIFCLAVLLLMVWGAMALWLQLPQQPVALWLVRWIAMALWIAAGLAMLAALTGLFKGKRRACSLATILFASAIVIMASWWSGVQPSHQRLWADDVAQLLESNVDGNWVHLKNVRNFEWRSETDYDSRWEKRSYNLESLRTADLVLSYWMGPHIAHTLVSFGFDDGKQLVFSLEIRKERQETFSAIAGFFRQYEQVLVAADERDILKTRSNTRGEDVYLYRLKMKPAQVRDLFMAYLRAAKELSNTPRFYNSLTGNCTTVVFELGRVIAPDLPLDYRLLLSGHFAEYAHDLGVLTLGYSYLELQSLGYINQRALESDISGLDFSISIRQTVPGVKVLSYPQK